MKEIIFGLVVGWFVILHMWYAIELILEAIKTKTPVKYMLFAGFCNSMVITFILHMWLFYSCLKVFEGRSIPYFFTLFTIAGFIWACGYLVIYSSVVIKLTTDIMKGGLNNGKK